MIKNLIYKHHVKATLMCFLASCSLALAANNELQGQKNIHANTDKAAPIVNELNTTQKTNSDNTNALYQEIIELIKQNSFKKAESKISVFLKKTAVKPEVYNLQALLKIQQKDNKAAQQSFEKALQIDPENIFANQNLAKLYLTEGQYDKAKVYATKALTVDDKTIATYFVLAEIANKQKDQKEVERLFLLAMEKAKSSEDEELQVFQFLSRYYMSTSQVAKMLKLAEDMNKQHPENALVLKNLAQAQILNNHKPVAEQILNKLVSQDKKDVIARLLLAQLLMEQPDKKQDVLKLLDEAVQSAPDNPEPLAYKAFYLIKQKNYTEAMELADKLNKKFPKLTLGKTIQANVYVSEKKLDKAIDIYQQIYKIQPNDKILSTLVDLMVIQKQIPEAIAFLEKERVKNEKNLTILFRLGFLYEQQNDDKKAEVNYKAILGVQPENVAALNNLANLYAKSNDPRALDVAEKAYALAPKAPEVADTYGFILVNQGDIEQGLLILEKTVAAAPKLTDIQYHLAIAYATNNNTKKAIEILTPIVESKQDFPERKAALTLLDKLKSKPL